MPIFVGTGRLAGDPESLVYNLLGMPSENLVQLDSGPDSVFRTDTEIGVMSMAALPRNP
jgi:hypothetical protein